MNTEFLNQLIEEGERLFTTIYSTSQSSSLGISFINYYTSDKDNYQNWQSSVTRFVKTNFPSDLEDIKDASIKLTPQNHRKVIGILKAIKAMPQEPEKTLSSMHNSTNNINITNNQTNSQTQQQLTNFILDTLKDELTGKNYGELRQILEEYKGEPDVAKPKLLEKIKSFGGDVLSNILANVLTNPAVYSGIS